MFDHISIGVSDVGRSRKFYNAALKPLGFTCLSDGETSLGYGDKAPLFWVNAATRPVKGVMSRVNEINAINETTETDVAPPGVDTRSRSIPEASSASTAATLSLAAAASAPDC